MKNSFFVYILFFTISCLGAEIEEKILAVVEDEVITSSEVELAIIMDGGTEADDRFELETVREKLMELIDEKLILLAAIEDSIEIDQSRADEFFKQRWQMLVEGYGGETALGEALNAEGFTIEGFKRKTRQQINDFMLKQRYIERNFGRIDVTEEDIDSFMLAYGDSLPPAPAEVKLEGIVIKLEADDAKLAEALDKINAARKSLEAGEEFGKVALEFSEDATTAEKGGLLGTFAPGDLLPAIDSVAFSLGFDTLGGPIKSPMGFHLLKVLDKSAGKITLAHILVKAEITPDRFNELVGLADSAYNLAVSGDIEFHKIAENFANSKDIEYIGDIDWLPVASIGKELSKMVAESAEGAILGPLQAENSLEIYRIAGKREGRKLTLEEDRATIEEFAKQFKTKKLIDRHLLKLRERYYLEVRI